MSLDMGMVSGLIAALAPEADPATIEQAVKDWLDDHPEATTTVQDGSITEAKLAQDVLADLAEIDTLSEAIAKQTEFSFSFDCYIDDSGEEVSSSISVSSDYIPLDGIKALAFTGVMGANKCAHWYDQSKTFVGYSLYVNDVMQYSINVLDTKPAGAKYVRLTAKKSETHKIYAYYGAEYESLLLADIVGDGVTDDTDALRRYINCATNAVIPSDKKILISGTINIDPASRKEANGNGATVIVDGDFYAFTVKGSLNTSSNPNLISADVKAKEAETKIKNFRITSSDGETGGGIEITKAFKLNIVDNYIYGLENGIRLYGMCRDINISRNNIYAMIEDGLLFDTDINLHQCNIENNMIQYCKNCIHIYHPYGIANFQIIGNDIEISSYPTTDTSLHKAIHFEGASTTYQLSEIEIVGNTIQGHGENYDVIRLVGDSAKEVSELNITGNHISNSYYRAIYLENCANVAITGNTYRYISTYIYEMFGTCENIVITGETSRNNGSSGGKIHAGASATLTNIKCKNVICTPYGSNNIETSNKTNVDIEEDVSGNGVSF